MFVFREGAGGMRVTLVRVEGSCLVFDVTLPAYPLVVEVAP